MVPWGEGLEYWKQVAALLEKAGADAVTVMPGWHESRAPRNQMCVPNDHFVYLAAGIKEAVNIPVAAGNNITDPLLAESIIASGRADFIAMGRPLIADPELPMKAKEGRFSEIRRCTRCCFCYECFPKGIPLACSVNPFVGREKAGPVVPAEKKKKVVVIGGGPAGMQAALTASERGHKVVLYEQSVRLGGQVIRAAVPPHKSEWLNLVKYLESELARKRVRTVLRSKVTADIIKKEGPDAVIIATGAVPFVPAIDGTGGKNVDGALDILDGKRRAGKQVVVIGGGSVGLETAEFLAVAGKKVIILEALARVGEDVGEHNRWVLIDRLVELGVRMETLSPVIEITDKGVWTGVNGLRYLFYEADTVVTATGMKPYNTLAGQLKGEVPLVKVIGDCLKPRKIKEAVEEGYLAGIEV
jgi:2,4-dienoyl-CoA reductase (NADPH2)